MLPKLSIKFDNGNAGFVEGLNDGVFALVASAEAVPGGFQLKTPYKVKSMEDVHAISITPSVENSVMYRAIQEFYAEAGEGTPLWILGIPKSAKVSDWFVEGVGGRTDLEKLLDKANGEISAIITKYSPTSTPVINEALDEDMSLAMSNAQAFAERYTAKKYAPIFVMLEGYAFTGNHTELPSLLDFEFNRVAVFVGDTEPRDNTPDNYNQANHILAGRLAKIQVHENAGKVNLGALSNTTAFIVNTPAELYDVESLHDKGYITFTTHVRKSGYYISDDPLATSFDDDYHYITRRRVIDKAYRLAYNIAIEELLNDFDLMPNGTLSPFYAKTVESKIESEIYNQMTVNGELSVDSNDNNDLGVTAIIDTTTNVAQTNKVKMSLKVRPKGHNRFFEILLGYQITENN